RARVLPPRSEARSFLLACADKGLANDNKTSRNVAAIKPILRDPDPERELSPPERPNGPPRRRADWRRRPRTPSSAFATLRKVVAIVDQDPRTRREIARLVSAFGFAAETFDGVTAFLKSTAVRRAACLVIELELAGGSGMELALRLAGAGCKCPVVFMTALDDHRSHSEAAAAGGGAFLRQPIRAGLLMQVMLKASRVE